MEKHLFAGASTHLGFIDFFEYVMPLQNAKKRYYLKGSSGSGKNTFLKKIITERENTKNLIELFHCANDPNSLDAIAIPHLGLSVMDATYPHSHDPQIPIAVDMIIDFAQFLDEKKISIHVDTLKQLYIDKKNSRKKINSYLSALHNVYSAENSTINKHIISESVQKYSTKIIQSNDIDIKHKGTDRKLFLSAITPDGFITFVDSYFDDTQTVYGLGNSCVASGLFLCQLKDNALMYGIDTESFYNPFDPTILEHLHLPQLGIAFVSTGDFGCKKEVTSQIFPISSKTSDLFKCLLDTIVNAMNESNSIHYQIESLYIEAMNFEGLNQLKLQVI